LTSQVILRAAGGQNRKKRETVVTSGREWVFLGEVKRNSGGKGDQKRNETNSGPQWPNKKNAGGSDRSVTRAKDWQSSGVAKGKKQKLP